MNETPLYDMKKIRFAADEATFRRAVDLYGKGKVTQVGSFGGYYRAVVLGTSPYHVSVSAKNHKHGHCTCYLGEKGTLCKHMTALAIHAVMDGKPLKDEDKEYSSGPKCGTTGIPLTDGMLEHVKKEISASMRHIRAYNGNSYAWFSYQDSLKEGCNMLSAVINGLPVNRQSADILVKLLLRLDKKLMTGGVDDSDGTVGGFMSSVVEILVQYARMDRQCVQAFKTLVGTGTSFQWEEPLVRIFDEGIPSSQPPGPAGTIKPAAPLNGHEFIGRKQARRMTKKIFESMPALEAAAKRFELDPADMIRFHAVSERCRQERSKRCLTLKQASAQMSIPQYRLKDIESSRMGNILPDILEQYINYLGLDGWYASWKDNNIDVYKRLLKKHP